ncbi:galactose-3-o-sulfotransferase 3 [Plakobranchus ocellatus]|uniref:Galactose-3-o-sulfotransferase 3 n=1 Tax=Plakobranchus ocellatus TaxID=259542 RepID=A0AAV4DUF6_9GAST|nr:galactose-3-o-sulfotransferase 3 [Plakobranchus ocellatus]
MRRTSLFIVKVCLALTFTVSSVYMYLWLVEPHHQTLSQLAANFVSRISTDNGQVSEVVNYSVIDVQPEHLSGDPNYNVMDVEPEQLSGDANYNVMDVESETDSEIRHVVFIKVHKAASSTLQNIMFRFSLARNLSVLLPKNPLDHINDSGRAINPDRIISHPKEGYFDILCDHIIFDEEVLAQYFPETAVRVAIVRDPMQQALSALVYFSQYFKKPELLAGIEKYKDSPLEGFLGHPRDFFKLSQPVVSSYINNRMSVDLGFDLTNFEASKKNKTKIRKFLSNLERQFDLILISEYFDESMVLLRRTLSWSMKDIIYLEVNTAQKNLQQFQKSIWNHKPMLNSTTMLTFRKWAAIDYELYHHFLVIFLNKIEAEESFMDEVSAFREARDEVAKFCYEVSDSGAKSSEKISLPETAWTKAFTVSGSDCHLMAMQETDMMALVGERQKQRFKLMRSE